MDDVRQTIRSLTAEKTQLNRRIADIERALDALRLLTTPSGPASGKRNGSSTYSMAVELISASDQEWTTSEVLSALRAQGRPISAQDPSNTIRTALSHAAKEGVIQRSGEGRYASVNWNSSVKNDADADPTNGAPNLSAQFKGPIPIPNGSFIESYELEDQEEPIADDYEYTFDEEPF